MASRSARLPIRSPSMARSGRLPPPDPVAMRGDGFSAFNDLLVANMRHAGALRIDHVMGLRRLFVIPDGAGRDRWRLRDLSNGGPPRPGRAAEPAREVPGRGRGPGNRARRHVGGTGRLEHPVLQGLVVRTPRRPYPSARRMAPPGRRLRLHPRPGDLGRMVERRRHRRKAYFAAAG